MFKKLIIYLVVFLSLFVSVNAITYLNGCGQSSGWINGETYIINFTLIPASEPGGACFSFDTNYNGMIFQGINQTIDVDKGMWIFFANNVQLQNVIFKDFKMNGNLASTSGFLYLYSGYGQTIRDIIVENIDITNFDYFVRFDRAHAYNSWFLDSNFNNLVLKLNTAAFFGGSNNDNHVNVTFTNSYIEAPLMYTQTQPPRRNAVNEHSNNVIIVGGGLFADTPWPNLITYKNSIIKGFPSADANNDGLGDSNPEPRILNPKIFIDLRDKRFQQDVVDGKIFLSNKNVFVEDETYGSTNAVLFSLFNGENADSSLATHLHTSQASIILNDGASLDCSILNPSQCIMSNSATSIISGDEYKGSIEVFSNTLINNIDYTSTDKLGGGSNVQVIANFNVAQQNNLTITNNKITSDGNYLTEGAPTLNLPILKLNFNNLNVNNNEFIVNSLNNNASFEFVDLQSTTPSNNIITRNTFTNLMTTPITKSRIFEYGADTQFYNNYLSNNIIVANALKSGLIINSLVGFNHTDGKIYYYNLGNFYEENTGCVDSDGSGICDLSYVSGAITDNYPLSYYPFDYTLHLFTADFIVDTNTFNITTYIDNTIFNSDRDIIVDNTDSLVLFEFKQNSAFPDLICDFIIDGTSVQTVVNPTQNTKYNISVNGWAEKLYTYRTECFNGFSFQSSTEYTFNLTFTPVTPPNDGGSSSTSYSSIDVIDYNSVENTNANTIGFMQDIIGFVTNVGIPLGILLVVVISVFAVLRLLI